MFVLLADTLWATANVLFKFVVASTTFTQLVAYESFGIAIGGLILFLIIVFIGKKKVPLTQRISTNVTVNNNQDSKKANVADELEKLHNLKEKGVITSDEFESKKKRLLL